jgi:hypothetical protein
MQDLVHERRAMITVRLSKHDTEHVPLQVVAEGRGHRYVSEEPRGLPRTTSAT